MDPLTRQLLAAFPYDTSAGPPILADVGACFGESTLPFARAGWRCLSIESDPRLIPALHAWASLYPGTVGMRGTLAAQANPDVKVFAHQNELGRASLTATTESPSYLATVDSLTLDDALVEHGFSRLSLLLLDTHGADHAILQGTHLCTLQPELILCGLHDARQLYTDQSDHHATAHFLASNGYAVFVSEWRTDPGPKRTFVRLSPYPLAHRPAWGYLIAVRQDRLAAFRETVIAWNRSRLEGTPATSPLSQYAPVLDPTLNENELHALCQTIAANPNPQNFRPLLAGWRERSAHLDEQWSAMADAFPALRPYLAPPVTPATSVPADSQRLAEVTHLLAQPFPTNDTLDHAAKILEKLPCEHSEVPPLLKKHALLRAENRGFELLAAYQNKHYGERCVIIGNGPSLNKMDLSFLNGETTFALNRIFLGFERFGFLPTYYVATNDLVIEQSATEIAAIPCPKFIASDCHHFLPVRDDILPIRSRISYDGAFSRDPRRGLFIGSTVTYITLQLAYYMGFTDVVLIGVDHRFKTQGAAHKEVTSGNDDPDHFDPNYFGKGFRWHLPDLDHSGRMYQLAQAFFEGMGRRVTDATLDGACPAFAKAHYRQLFFDSPRPAPQPKPSPFLPPSNPGLPSIQVFGRRILLPRGTGKLPTSLISWLNSRLDPTCHLLDLHRDDGVAGLCGLARQPALLRVSTPANPKTQALVQANKVASRITLVDTSDTFPAIDHLVTGAHLQQPSALVLRQARGTLDILQAAKRTLSHPCLRNLLVYFENPAEAAHARRILDECGLKVDAEARDPDLALAFRRI